MNQADFNSLCKILQDEKTMYAYEGAFNDAEVQEWLDKQLSIVKQFKCIHSAPPIKYVICLTFQSYSPETIMSCKKLPYVLCLISFLEWIYSDGDIPTILWNALSKWL